MRLVNVLADRLVGLVAPKAAAGACIPPDPWEQECNCRSCSIWAKNCHYNCTGQPICGTCFNTFISCCT